jgi:hypothetical protein
MKGHKLHGETHHKIEKHIAKHRKYGGATKTVKGHGAESATDGRDEADMDLEIEPADRTFPGGGKNRQENVGNMAKIKTDRAEEHKHGGKVKKHRKEGGPVAGDWGHHSAGRRARASGGGVAEDHPFTTAHKSTPAKGRKVERMSEGSDEE